MALSPVTVGVEFGSVPTVSPIDQGFNFGSVDFNFGFEPIKTDFTFSQERINLGSLRDAGFLPPPQILVDQALSRGIDATTGLALDPVNADLASQYKIAALGNSPKFIEQGFRADLMHATAAGIFNGYVQTLEATDPRSLDPYRISTGIYLIDQLADGRRVFSFLNDDGFHYVRSNLERGDTLLAYIRSNEMSPSDAQRLIQRGLETNLFSFVPHQAVEDVAQVILANTVGVDMAAPAPAVAPVEVAEDPFQNPADSDFSFAEGVSLAGVPVIPAVDPRAADLAYVRHALGIQGVPFAHIEGPNGGLTTIVQEEIDPRTSFQATMSQLRQLPENENFNVEQFMARLGHIINTTASGESPIFAIGGGIGVQFLSQDSVNINAREFVNFDPVTGETTFDEFNIVAGANQAARLLLNMTAAAGIPIGEDAFLTLSAMVAYQQGHSTQQYDDTLNALRDPFIDIPDLSGVAELVQRQDTPALLSTLLRVQARVGDVAIGVGYDPLNNIVNVDALARATQALQLGADVSITEAGISVGGQALLNTGGIQLNVHGRTGPAGSEIQGGFTLPF